MTLADLLRGIPPEMRALAAADPHLPFVFDAVVRAKHHDVKVAERKMKRAMLGGCECGFVRGEDVCPQCDLGIAIPIPRQELLEARAMMREFLETLATAGKQIGDAAREGTREVADLAAAMKTLAPKKKRAVTLTARPLNRFERRRERSRRWRT